MMAIDPQLHRYTPERSVQLLSAARERIAALPGVISATTTDGVPLSMGHRSDGFEVPGRSEPQGENSVELYMAGPTTSQPSASRASPGATSEKRIPPRPRSALSTKSSCARFFQGENPVGHMVTGAGVPTRSSA